MRWQRRRRIAPCTSASSWPAHPTRASKKILFLHSSRLARENRRRFTRSPLEPSQNDVWVTSAKFHTDDVHYPDLGSASDWLKENSLAAQPMRSTTEIWVLHVTSMEFLRSLLRPRFARAQVATSWSVGCFLRLLYILNHGNLCT